MLNDDISRRHFFRLVRGCAALVALPVAASARQVPMIYSDGVHDDLPGLIALQRGEVVEFADPAMAHDIGWRGDHCLELNGRFWLDGPMLFVDLENCVVRGGTFFSSVRDVAFAFDRCREVTFSNMSFQWWVREGESHPNDGYLSPFVIRVNGWDFAL